MKIKLYLYCIGNWLREKYIIMKRRITFDNLVDEDGNKISVDVDDRDIRGLSKAGAAGYKAGKNLRRRWNDKSYGEDKKSKKKSGVEQTTVVTDERIFRVYTNHDYKKDDDNES